MTQEEFEELTPEQNQIIQEARELGYKGCEQPCPDNKTKAILELEGAINFVKEKMREEEEKFNWLTSKLMRK